MASCPNRNKFCFVCGLYAPSGHNRSISKNFEEAFTNYFKLELVHSWYKPNVVCITCSSDMLSWNKNKSNRLKYV